MKKLLATMLVMFASAAVAGPHHGYHGHRGFGHWHNHNHYQNRHSWVLPALIGGAVVYSATRPAPVIQPAPEIVYQSNQMIINGQLYVRQIMIINGVAQEVYVKVE